MIVSVNISIFPALVYREDQYRMQSNTTSEEFALQLARVTNISSVVVKDSEEVTVAGVERGVDLLTALAASVSLLLSLAAAILIRLCRHSSPNLNTHDSEAKPGVEHEVIENKEIKQEIEKNLEVNIRPELLGNN